MMDNSGQGGVKRPCAESQKNTSYLESKQPIRSGMEIYNKHREDIREVILNCDYLASCQNSSDDFYLVKRYVQGGIALSII